jgi:hypothetical protein
LFRAAGTTVNFGLTKQVPFMNAGATNFSYASTFTFNSTAKSLLVGTGNTNASTPSMGIFGDANTVTGGGWGVIGGENNVLSGGGGDVGLFGLRNSITNGGSQLVYGTDNTTETANGLVGGVNAKMSNTGNTYPGIAIGIGLQSTSKVLSVGSSINISNNDVNQTNGFGSLAYVSTIIGGSNHNIPVGANRSVILGGYKLHMLSTDTSTVYVDNLRIRHESGSGTRMLTVTADGHVSNQAIPGGGGITNTAAANEMAKSDGTNLVPSGTFSTTAGNLTLGSSSISGDRTIDVASSSSTSNLSFTSKGTTGLFNFNNASWQSDLTLSQSGNGTIQFLHTNYGNTTHAGLLLKGYVGNSTTTQGGDITLIGGTGYSTGATNGGEINIYGGIPNSTGNYGRVSLNTGAGNVSSIVVSSATTDEIVMTTTDKITLTVSASGFIVLTNVPTSATCPGGAPSGALYKTAAGVLQICP